MSVLQQLVALDVHVLNAMRSWIDPLSAWQVSLVHVFADIEVLAAAVFLVGLWLYGRFRGGFAYQRAALLLFYGIAVSFLFYVLLNLGLPVRPRPESVSAIRPLIDHLPDNSFPSGHAIFAMASVLGVAFFLPSRRAIWTAVFAILSVGMCVARILAGVHYPGDILVGAIVGMIGPFVVAGVSGRTWFETSLIGVPARIARLVRL